MEKLSETFFVVGNGPSLSPRHLEMLPDGQWLGMNSAYRYWATIDKYPRYYACLDPVVIKSQAEGILQLLDEGRIEAFFLHQAILELEPRLQEDKRISFLQDFLKARLRFPMGEMAMFKKTTGSLATRFVIEKGHHRLCLLGIDCNYVEVLDEAKKLEGLELEISTSVKKNPNYFFADYQSPGDKYQLPNPPRHDGNMHLQSFVALQADLLSQKQAIDICVTSPKSLLYQYAVFRRESLHHLLNIRRLACVAVPLIARELDDFLENLDLWDNPRLLPSLQQGTKATVLQVFIDTGYDQAIVDKLNAKLSSLSNVPNFFSSFKITFLDLPEDINYYYKKGQLGDGDFCRKSGPNIQFLALMAHCKDYEYSFLMEADCVPVRSGWLDALEASIGMGSSFDPWIMGAAYEGPSAIDPRFRFHINGNAIYHTGDRGFQDFIFTCFLQTLQDVIAKGHDQLAYDTLISSMMDKPQMSKACPDFISRISSYYRFTKVIRNYGGDLETSEPASIDYASLLKQDKDCYLVHGRNARRFVCREYPNFDLLFPYNPDARAEILAFDECSIPKTSAQWTYLSKGLLEIRNAPESFDIFLFFIRLARRDASEVRVSFDLDPETKLMSAAVISQTDSFSRLPLVTEISSQGNSYSLKARIVENGQAYRRLGMRLQLKGDQKTVRLHNLLVQELALLPLCQPGQGFVLEPIKEDAVEVIQDWQQYLEQQRKAKNIISQQSCIPVKAIDFAKNHVKIDFGSSIFTEIPQKQHDPIFQIITKTKLLRQPTLNISLNAPRDHSVLLRIARYGKTKWEFVDVELQGKASKRIKTPFTSSHEAFRIELLRLECSADAAFSVEISTGAALEALSSGTGMGLDNYWDVQAKKKRLLHSLVKNEPEEVQSALAFLLRTPYPQELVQSLAKTLLMTQKSLAFVRLQEAVRNVAETIDDLNLPKLAYLDPIGKDTVSATQELRKKLLASYDKFRLYHIFPIAAKPGFWQMSLPNQNPVELSTADISRALEKEGIDLVIIRCGYLREDAALLYDTFRQISHKTILYMMDTWDERLNYSKTEQSQQLLTAFAQLVRECRALIVINQAMARHMQSRYKRSSDAVVHNFLESTSFRQAKVQVPRHLPLTFFYGGGLEQDMTFDSLLQIARQFKQFGADLGIRLVLKTFKRHTPLLRQLQQTVGQSSHIDYINVDLSTADYQKLLSEVDVFLLTYNFDERSASYVSSSFPNKLTDYLSYLKPIVYFGPDFAIVDEIKNLAVQGVTWTQTPEAFATYLREARANYPYYLRSLHTHKERIARMYGEERLLNQFYDLLFRLSLQKDFPGYEETLQVLA